MNKKLITIAVLLAVGSSGVWAESTTEIESGVAILVTFRDCVALTSACDGISPIVQSTYDGLPGDVRAAAFQSSGSYGEVQSAATLSGQIGSPVLRVKATSVTGTRNSTNTVALQKFTYRGVRPADRTFGGSVDYELSIAPGGDGFGLSNVNAVIAVYRVTDSHVTVRTSSKGYFEDLLFFPPGFLEFIGADQAIAVTTTEPATLDLRVPVHFEPNDSVWVWALLQTPVANGSIVDASQTFVTTWDDPSDLVPASEPEEVLTPLLERSIGVGPGNSLADKIRLAQTYLAAQDLQSTCEILKAFRNELAAQMGKRVTAMTAEQLSDESNEIQFALGCR